MQVQMEGLVVIVGLCEWAVEKTRRRQHTVCTHSQQDLRLRGVFRERNSPSLMPSGGQVDPKIIPCTPILRLPVCPDGCYRIL